MKIAVDIDSTMNQAFYYDYIHGKEICQEYNHDYKYDPHFIHVREQFQMSEELYNEYMRRYFPWNVKLNKLLPCTAESIRLLQRDGHEIFIMTARQDDFDKPFQPYNGKMMVCDTYEWLNKNKIAIPKNNILFGVRKKGEKCKELGFDILIDDDPKNINNAVENGIHVWMMPYPYNEYLVGSNDLISVMKNGWIDIINVLSPNSIANEFILKK